MAWVREEGVPRLRRRLLFKSRKLYYGVIVADLVLRFFWMLTLLPENQPTFGKDVQVGGFLAERSAGLADPSSTHNRSHPS